VGVIDAGVDALDALRDAVAAAEVVVPRGGGTHWEVGGSAPSGVDVTTPAGIIAYEPAELTVTVGAGTTVADLAGVLGAAGQESVLDPRDPARATVGGTLAVGLSGPRRLRWGPLRDRVLEVRFVTADGRVVKGGGPTVKNVTGYDLPRLLIGSLGTIGVLVQVTLRCQPLPPTAVWLATDNDPFEAAGRLFRPSCIAWDGRTTKVLLEGHTDDVDAQARAAGLRLTDVGPTWPDGPHRGRISVRPRKLRQLASRLDAVDGLEWTAEVGVGTVHVAAPVPEALGGARQAAEAEGGWLLREAGGAGLDGFGGVLPNRALLARIKAAYDPAGKLNPGRLPL
jgi:glycolate oxidase FAD binding subunit